MNSPPHASNKRKTIFHKRKKPLRGSRGFLGVFKGFGGGLRDFRTRWDKRPRRWDLAHETGGRRGKKGGGQPVMALGMVLAPVMVPVMVPVPGQGDRGTPLVGDGRRVRGERWLGYAVGCD